MSDQRCETCGKLTPAKCVDCMANISGVIVMKNWTPRQDDQAECLKCGRQCPNDFPQDKRAFQFGYHAGYENRGGQFEPETIDEAYIEWKEKESRHE
jgi:hypothetical protein